MSSKQNILLTTIPFFLILLKSVEIVINKTKMSAISDTKRVFKLCNLEKISSTSKYLIIFGLFNFLLNIPLVS